MIKVGLELFVQAGPEAVKLERRSTVRSSSIQAPRHPGETVERAVASASNPAARLITVHASGGRTMLKAPSSEPKEGGTLAICAVTILTSLDDNDLDDVGSTSRSASPPRARPRSVSEEAEGGRARAAPPRTSRLAYEEGVRWFVCSPAEVAILRAKLGPGAIPVTPGIRPADASAGDQKRIATPQQAIKDGANWLVVGRPILRCSEPPEAAKRIAASVQ